VSAYEQARKGASDSKKHKKSSRTHTYLDQRSDLPEQYRAIGWVRNQLYAVIFEVREDNEGEYYHLVTLWKATNQELRLYEEHS